MTDFFLDNKQARSLIKTLGLPLPMPAPLKRAKDVWETRPLQDAVVVVGGDPNAELLSAIAGPLTEAGANPHLVDSAHVKLFAEPGEAYGRPPRSLSLGALPEGFKARAFVFDATGITTPAELDALWSFFHPLMYHLESSGRIVVLGRDPMEGKSAVRGAAQAALEGFVRSIAKEVGKRGSTAQLITVARGAEDRIAGPLRWVLSPRSAFVTGQPLHVSADVALPEGGAKWVQPLENKVVLLTGAARGIGKATAKLLAGEGATVVCLDRPQDDQLVSQVAREIGGHTLLADVSDPEAPANIRKEIEERFGRVDVVIHNAGVTRDKTLAKMSEEKWDQVLDINLAAIARITEALLEGPMADEGRIILLSSIAGIAGNMGQTNYAASKAGVIGYVKQLSNSLAERGITVNAIAPGFIETRLTAAVPVMIREFGRRLSALAQGGQPKDVGEALTFLATPGAAGVNGQILRVCGGGFIGA